MALNNLNMVFGGEKSPNTLSQENIVTLMNAAEDTNCDIVLGGYVKVTGGIKESQKQILESKGLHIIDTQTIPDTFRIYADSNVITEDSQVAFKSYNIALDTLEFSIANVQVNSTSIASSVVKSRITMEGNILKVRAADENATWSARVTVSAHPTWSESNVQTTVITVNAIGVTSVEIQGPDQVASNDNAIYTVKLLPENNTKYDPTLTWSCLHGTINNSGSYIATGEGTEDTITVSANYYGTAITGTKKITIGQNVLDNDLQNPRVFNVVKTVLKSDDSVTSYTSMDLQAVTNEQITQIWDGLRGLGSIDDPITFDEFRYFTGVSVLSSENSSLLNLQSVKFPVSLKKIEGSVLTLNGLVKDSFTFADCTDQKVALYGNTFMGSTLKRIDLQNVSDVYFGGIDKGIGYGICYDCNQLEVVNWRSIYNWNKSGRSSSLLGGHFQNCTKLKKIYTNGFNTYEINSGIFYNDAALQGVFTQEDVVDKNFGKKLTNTSLTNQFYNCQLFDMEGINPDITILADNVFYNCKTMVIDQSMPYLSTLGNSFSGADNCFASNTFNMGSSSSALTVILPSTYITPSNVTKLVIGNKYATTLSKSDPDNFSANYSNIKTLDISALTKLKNVYYSVLCGFKNIEIVFNTTSVPTLNGFDDQEFTSTIKVPASLYNEWIAASNWSQIRTHIQSL